MDNLWFKTEVLRSTTLAFGCSCCNFYLLSSVTFYAVVCMMYVYVGKGVRGGESGPVVGGQRRDEGRLEQPL